MSNAIAVFLRPPVVGEVKTRLAAVIGTEAATQLYRAFLEDTLTKVGAIAQARSVRVELWVAGDPQHPSLAWIDRPWPRYAQPASDLGTRQEVALTHCLTHSENALCLGSDLPTLPPANLERALTTLASGQPVLGPAADGGYYLLGLHADCPAGLLADVRWSHRHTLADTRRALSAHGLQALELPPHYDVDNQADLRLLATHLALDSTAAPQTQVALGRLGD